MKLFEAIILNINLFKYYNFEYQTGKIKLKDLRRFNLYHATLIDKYQTENVCTIIIYTEKIEKNTKYKTEQICFKPKIFSLKEFNGNKILNNIKRKIKNNEKITKEEITHLAQLPLYKNKKDEKEVLYEVCKITNQIQEISQEDLDYVKISQIMLVDKIITDEKEKEKYLEEIGMEKSPTLEKIINEHENRIINQAKEEGIERGIEKSKFNLTRNMLKENIPIDNIMRITGLSEEEIENIQ